MNDDLAFDQYKALRELILKELQAAVSAEPVFWAGWISGQMTAEMAWEFLDLDNRPDAADIIKRLGFDPRKSAAESEILIH